MKIKSFIPILILLSIMLTSCSSSPYSYTYPKEYSAEYCYEQYELFDPNIVYTECYEFVSKKNYGFNPSVNFSAVKDCDDLSFMVFYKKFFYLGGGHIIQVVRNRDSKINPITDFTPSSVELVWLNGMVNPDPERNADNFHNYEAQCFSQTASIIDSQKAIDEIMNAVAAKDTVLPYDLFQQERKNEIDDIDTAELNIRFSHGENGALYIKISFIECAGLVFIGKVWWDDHNRSYMEHIVYLADEFQDVKDATKLKQPGISDCLEWRFYYRLGENMDAFIQPIISSIVTNPVSQEDTVKP